MKIFNFIKSKNNSIFKNTDINSLIKSFNILKKYYVNLYDGKNNLIKQIDKSNEIKRMKFIISDINKLEQNIEVNVKYLETMKNIEDYNFALIALSTELIRYNLVLDNLKSLLNDNQNIQTNKINLNPYLNIFTDLKNIR